MSRCLRAARTKRREPHRVERLYTARRPRAHHFPERFGFLRLPAGPKSAAREKEGDQLLEPLRSRVGKAGFPGVDGLTRDAEQAGELALGQASSVAKGEHAVGKAVPSELVEPL